MRDPENPTVGLGLGLPGLNPQAYSDAERRLVQGVLDSSAQVRLAPSSLSSLSLPHLILLTLLQTETDRSILEFALKESEQEAADRDFVETSRQLSELEEAQAALDEAAILQSLNEF